MVPHSTPPTGGGLYIIWLSDTHYYGGRAKKFLSRWSRHLRWLKNGDHPNQHMQNVYNKFGRFEPIILTAIECPDTRLASEQFWLDRHVGKPGCVNISKYADGKMHGSLHSEETKRGFKRRRVSLETRKKISETLRGRTLSPKHRENISEGNRGKKISEEHRQILIACNKTRGWSEESLRKLSKSLQGHTRSEESRRKQSETIRSNPELLQKARESLTLNRRKLDPEKMAERAREMAEANRGRTRSEAHRRAIGAAHRGRRNSPETLARMSEAAKVRATLTPTQHGQATRELISTQQKGRIWVNDGEKNKRLFPEDAQPLLESGWVRGKLGACGSGLWVHRYVGEALERGRVPKEELSSKLSQGWSRGKGSQG